MADSDTRDSRIVQLVEDFVASMGGRDAMRRAIDYADLVGLIESARKPTPEVREAFKIMEHATVVARMETKRIAGEGNQDFLERCARHDRAIAIVARALGIEKEATKS